METENYVFGFMTIALILAFGAMWCFEYIPAGYVGVENRLGNVKQITVQPGVVWTGFFTSIEQFSSRIMKSEYEATAGSKDLQDVIVNVALNYRIIPTKAPDIFKNIGTDGVYEVTFFQPLIQEAVKSQTALFNAEELVQQRETIKNKVVEQLKGKLEDQGVELIAVSLTNFKFSPAYAEAIEKKQIAFQNSLEAENRLKEANFTSQAMRLQQEVIEIKKLDLQKAWIDKWSGNLPQYVGTGDAIPMMPVGVGMQ